MPRALLDTILSSPNLDTIWAYYRNHTITAPTPLSTRISGRSLRFLQASESAFLDSLSLPALETVWLGPDKYRQSLCPKDTLPSLLRLITASQCSLTRLIPAEIDTNHGIILVFQRLTPWKCTLPGGADLWMTPCSFFNCYRDDEVECFPRCQSFSTSYPTQSDSFQDLNMGSFKIWRGVIYERHVSFEHCRHERR